MKKEKILLLYITCVVVIILALLALDFSIIKYKEITWRDKIKVGMSEKKVYSILPIKNGGCRLAHGTHRSGFFELTDGTTLYISFHIPQKVIEKYFVESAKKYDMVDTRNANFQYVLESYKIGEDE